MYIRNIKKRQAFRKLAKVERELWEKGDNTVAELAQMGKFKAKEIAPFDTGKTARMIRAIVRGARENTTAQIISPASKTGFGSNSIIVKKYNSSIPKFLHSKDYERLVKNKSGTPYYMYKVSDYLNAKKKSVAEANFKKIKVR